MNVRVPDLLIAALLAAGFAAVGETTLRRCSRDVLAWNESFLVGMAVCAAALFPLSLLFPHGALVAELALMGSCVLTAAARRVRARPGPPVRPSPRDPATLLLLAAVLFVAGCFVALDLRYNLLWDAFQIWASKTQLLFYEGALGRSWYPGDTYELRHLPYPPLVPLYEALLDLVRGRFDFDSFKPVFLPFYFSMLVSVYGAARALVPAQRAMLAALLLALLPPLSTSHAAGGYADMPQAAFVAGVVSAALNRRERGNVLPWLIGGLTTVKAEGTILAVVACGAVLLCWLLERSPEEPLPFRSRWKGIAVVALFLGLRAAYIRWLGVEDSVYGTLTASRISEALARLPLVARVCLVKLLSPRRWGLLWPAFGLAGIVLFLRGTSTEKSLVAATASAAIVLATVFLFTTWPLELHIDQAYPRLLEQLAPAAVVCLVIGFGRAEGSMGGSAAA